LKIVSVWFVVSSSQEIVVSSPRMWKGFCRQ